MNNKSLNLLIMTLFFIAVLVISFFVSAEIKSFNVKILYFLFCILFNLYLLLSIFKFKSIFSLIFSISFWFGFYLQLTLKYLAGKNKNFSEIDYFFRLSEIGKVEVLILSNLICLLFLSISLLNKVDYKEIKSYNYSSLNIYKENRSYVLLFIYVFFITILIINYFFGLYQKGYSHDHKLLAYFFSFLLQLLIPSVLFMIFNYEFYKSRKKYLLISIFLFLIILPLDLSILSRYTGFTSFCIVLCFISFFNMPINFKTLIKTSLIGLFIVLISYINVSITNYSRDVKFYEETKNESVIQNYKIDGKKKIISTFLNNKKINNQTFYDLFINRFIGIDKISSLLIIDTNESKLLEAINYEFFKKKSNIQYYDWYLYKYNVGHSYVKDNLGNQNLVGNNVLGLFGYLFLSKSILLVLSFTLFILLILRKFEKFLNLRYQNFWLSFFIIYFISNKIIHLSAIKTIIVNSISVIFLLVLFEAGRFFYTKKIKK